MNFEYNNLKSPNGAYIKARYILKNFPEEYKKTIDYSIVNSTEHLPFPQKLWIYFHQTDGIPKCKCCNNNVRFESYNYGYKKYCSVKCASNDKDWKNNRKATNLERYGVEEVGYSIEIQDKTKNTLFTRYGITNPMESIEFVNNIKKTMLKKHGVENPMNLQENVDKMMQSHMINNGIFSLSDPKNRKTREINVSEAFLSSYPKHNFISYSDTTLILN